MTLSPPLLTFLGFGPHNYIHHCLLIDPRFVTQITFSGKRIKATRETEHALPEAIPAIAAHPNRSENATRVQSKKQPAN